MKKFFFIFGAMLALSFAYSLSGCNSECDCTNCNTEECCSKCNVEQVDSTSTAIDTTTTVDTLTTGPTE